MKVNAGFSEVGLKIGIDDWWLEGEDGVHFGGTNKVLQGVDDGKRTNWIGLEGELADDDNLERFNRGGGMQDKTLPSAIRPSGLCQEEWLGGVASRGKEFITVSDHVIFKSGRGEGAVLG